MNRATHGGFSLVRRLPGGAWGAWLLRDARGRPAVMKCVWDTDWRAQLVCAERVVEALQRRSAPAPRFRAWDFDAAVGTWFIVDWLAGTPVEQLDERLLSDVLEFSDLAADAAVGPGADGCISTAERLTVVMDDGSPERRAMRTHSRETAALLDEFDALREERGARADRAGVTQPRSHDAVHGDFLVTQLLVGDRGELVGVLDWDNACWGDRAFDLALLFLNVHAQEDRTGRHPGDEVFGKLAKRGTEISGEAFATYLAYHLLKMVGFVVRHNPAHVAWRSDLARRVIATYRRTLTG
ncbi:MAG: phosphotransferase family protein [Candidatus Limnocylindria bacterium]